jgi:DNA-binding IclR family transcriptional regulator
MPPEAYFVARTMQVLELLAFQPLSAPQVAASLQIHPRTARRVLVRLYEEGYLIRSDDTRRRYAPSMRIVALAGQVTARSPLTALALPIVVRLHEHSRRAAHLVVPSYRSALCIVHADGTRSARACPHELIPAHCTATGKALLAWRQRWRDSVLGYPLERFTQHTIVDPAELARDADATRARGYATDDGQYQDGVRAVAAPVFADGHAIAALGVSAPDLEVEAVAGPVVALAARLTEALAEDPGAPPKHRAEALGRPQRAPGDELAAPEPVPERLTGARSAASERHP